MEDPSHRSIDNARASRKQNVAALAISPKIREQRRPVHKTAYAQEKLPKCLRPRAKELRHVTWMADTLDNANKAFD